MFDGLSGELGWRAAQNDGMGWTGRDGWGYAMAAVCRMYGVRCTASVYKLVVRAVTEWEASRKADCFGGYKEQYRLGNRTRGTVANELRRVLHRESWHVSRSGGVLLLSPAGKFPSTSPAHWGSPYVLVHTRSTQAQKYVQIRTQVAADKPASQAARERQAGWTRFGAVRRRVPVLRRREGPLIRYRRRGSRRRWDVVGGRLRREWIGVDAHVEQRQQRRSGTSYTDRSLYVTGPIRWVCARVCARRLARSPFFSGVHAVSRYEYVSQKLARPGGCWCCWCCCWCCCWTHIDSLPGPWQRHATARRSIVMARIRPSPSLPAMPLPARGTSFVASCSLRVSRLSLSSAERQ